MKYTIEYCGISESDVKLVKDYYSSIYKDLTVSALPTSGLAGGISRSIANPSVVMIILTENAYSEVKKKAPRFSTAKKIYKFTNSEDLEAYCREQTSLPSRPVPEDEDKDAPELPSSNTELENTHLPSRPVPEDEDKDAPELVPTDLPTEEQSSSNIESEDTDVPEITSIDLPTEANFTEDQPSSNIELEAKIKELSDALNLANKENTHLQEELNGRDVVVRNLQKQVQDLEDLSTETKELEEKNKELEAEVTKLNEQAQGVNNDLQTKLDSAESKNKELEDEVTKLKEQIQGVDAELQTKLDSAESKNKTLEAEVAKLNEHIQEVKNDLQTKLDSAENKNKELEETKQNLEADVIELNERLQGVDAELQAKLNSTENNNEELEKVRQNLEEQLDIVQDLNNQITSLTEENSTLNSKIEEMNTKEEDLASQITSMYDKLAISDTQLANKDKEYEVLQSTCEEQRAANKALQAELDAARENLDAEKSSRVSLEGELSVLRINSEKQVASEEEVSELTTKLRDAQQEVQNLIGYKSRCTELEIQLAEQKAKSTPSGVFAGLGKMQALRSVFTTKAFNSISLTTDTICVAAGSSESVTDTYNLIRTSCQATNKRCLILDLSLDSYIDREFGCRGILSPVDWLAGKAPYTNFLSKTSLPNAMIISLGLAYTNDVALLSIDWQSKLNEIKDFADKIIIYVGPLINTVSKILFNSFSNSIQSHVVLKATPINIRTLLLTLTGLTSLNNSMLSIDCVNYTTNSKVMYENLAAKYNSRILGSTEVIQL